MRSPGALAVLVALSACSGDYELISNDAAVPERSNPPTDAGALDSATGPMGPPLPACRAQRVVHVVAGLGSLAWFTLLWPLPPVITTYTSAYAYDDPLLAVPALPNGLHLLYVRKVTSTSYLWEGIGTRPLPTAFVVGDNATHTTNPQTVTLPNGRDVIAAGAAAQIALQPALPVLRIGTDAGYVPGANAPPLVDAADVTAAITALGARVQLTPRQQDALTPTATKAAVWTGSSSYPPALAFAQQLSFAASAFEEGFVGTVILPGFEDDPHGAFSDLIDLRAKVNALAGALQAFYAELATVNEASCGTGTGPLTLADNVVLVVSGDTPKSSYMRSAWPDGTASMANILYVRSNGFLAPGWFGDLKDASRTNFDPTTGALSVAATNDQVRSATLKALHYAISRGDKVTTEALEPGTPYAAALAP